MACRISFSFPCTGFERPFGIQEVEVPGIYRQLAHEGGEVYNSANPQEKNPVIHFCSRLSRPQGLIADGSIKSIKISSDPIGNRVRDPPACSAVM